MAGQLLCTGPGYHVERGFGHVCVGVVTSFSLAVEHTLHARDIDHVGSSAPTHNASQLACDIEWHG